MKISFRPLCEDHYTFLLKWLVAPHVKAWWDPDIQWTLPLIEEKYEDYVKGYKVENDEAKPISAYIIYADNKAIGYIQLYNAYDFARSEPLIGLPSSLAAFDIFIGEENYLRKGIGSKAIIQFLEEHGNYYSHIFVDPDKTNLAAIRTYEKAGFKKVKEKQDGAEIFMLLLQTSAISNLIKQLELSLLDSKVRQSKEQWNKLINKLIADDFIEYGRSGKTYNKNDCFEIDENHRIAEVIDFKIKELSKEVILASYKTTENGLVTMRSSIWKKFGDDWKMIFHKGTDQNFEPYEK